MKENIGLIVLEHLRHKLHVHVLDVDRLKESLNLKFEIQTPKMWLTCSSLFNDMIASLSFS